MSSELVRATKDGLIRQLEELRDAIHQFAQPLSDQQFWKKPFEPSNSFGHLVLHLTGNLNHFAGARLGNTGYVRDREREFTEPRPPTQAVALAKLDEAVAIFRKVVESLSDEQLIQPHPDTQMGTIINGLIRLVAHFALHRGQISYIVRIIREHKSS